MEKYKVLLVEDNAFERQTLSYELKKQENIEFLAALTNGAQAVEFVKKQAPDIILMDVSMPVMDGISATKEIKQFNSQIKIIMLTSHSDKNTVFEAFSSKANAYCIKNIKIKELMQIIEMVADGNMWLDKSIAGYIFEIMKNFEDNSNQENNTKTSDTKTLEDYNITPRERNVLKLIADGYSNIQIANELVISLNTVKNHVANIINKLSLKDRTQIAVFTLKNNLLN